MNGHYYRPQVMNMNGRSNATACNRGYQAFPSQQAIIWHPVIPPTVFNPSSSILYNVTPCLRPVYSNSIHPCNLHSFTYPLASTIGLQYPNLCSQIGMSGNEGLSLTSGEIKQDNLVACFAGGEKRKLDEDEPKDRKKAKQETKALKAKRPGFTEERYNETSYYEDSGLRKVYPYYFTFTTFCKGRWVGQPILEIFAKEFRAHPPEEYERCIKSGSLTVNYKTVDVDYKLQHNDLLANTVHRHEVPVATFPIEILHESDDLVVVDKPPSIPVHPCGRYRHNTVVFILAKEFNLKNLRTIHRLDRLTSGLLLFGRSLKKARQLEHEIRSRLVSKQYICRVAGEFPTETITCEEPIEVVSYKIGVCRVGTNGKECKTEFERLSYNGETSVVLCKPRTGRMHQIRVHLQYLGYPIINDPLYNHAVFGPERGKGGRVDKSNDELIAELIRIHNAENWLGLDGDEDFLLPKPDAPVKEEIEINPGVENPSTPEIDHSVSSTSDKINTDQEIENKQNEQPAVSTSSSPPSPLLISKSLPENKQNKLLPLDPSKIIKDSNCFECKVKFRDPKPDDLVMFLHAWSYKGPDWEYKTKLPDWADEDWKK